MASHVFGGFLIELRSKIGCISEICTIIELRSTVLLFGNSFEDKLQGLNIFEY